VAFGMVQELFDVSADQTVKVTGAFPTIYSSTGTAGMLSWPARAERYVLYQAASPDGPWEPLDTSVIVANHHAIIEL
jgi:hypothetical protein